MRDTDTIENQITTLQNKITEATALLGTGDASIDDNINTQIEILQAEINILEKKRDQFEIING